MIAPSEASGQATPRSPAGIRAQLNDLAKVLKLARGYGAVDSASQQALETLEGHEAELLAELRAAERALVVGADGNGATVPARTLETVR